MKADTNLHYFPQSSPEEFCSEVGLYIHVPYCLQKCHYCDFVKFSINELPPIEDYVKLLMMELASLEVRPQQTLRTIYFGGGTPSLLSFQQLEWILKSIDKKFPSKNLKEICLEINPGTLNKEQLKELQSIGFNRFSLGVQTFNALFLDSCGRKHQPDDSLRDIQAFQELDLNYSIDLLFGIPGQELKDLAEDLRQIKSIKPPHVSAYNLTLPEKHFFNQGRASDESQLKMMDLICQSLEEIGCHRYEISNFAQKSKEAVHNRSYWLDREYFGIGMGAHSYFYKGSWGTRYWNTGRYKNYEKCVKDPSRPYQNSEKLELHEALTDFCHTHLRQTEGLSKKQILSKFGEHSPDLLWSKLEELVQKRLLKCNNSSWSLSETGLKIPNEVFRSLCFLKKDLKDERQNK